MWRLKLFFSFFHTSYLFPFFFGGDLATQTQTLLYVACLAFQARRVRGGRKKRALCSPLPTAFSLRFYNGKVLLTFIAYETTYKRLVFVLSTFSFP